MQPTVRPRTTQRTWPILEQRGRQQFAQIPGEVPKDVQLVRRECDLLQGDGWLLCKAVFGVMRPRARCKENGLRIASQDNGHPPIAQLLTSLVREIVGNAEGAAKGQRVLV